MVDAAALAALAAVAAIRFKLLPYTNIDVNKTGSSRAWKEHARVRSMRAVKYPAATAYLFDVLIRMHAVIYIYIHTVDGYVVCLFCLPSNARGLGCHGKSLLFCGNFTTKVTLFGHDETEANRSARGSQPKLLCVP